MNSGPVSPTDRAGLPPAPRRLDVDVSRVAQAAVPAGAPTSSWLGAGRTARRLAMPIAWLATLALCAGSAFAVRDVVFPSLGETATRSLWEPKPSASTSPSPIRSTTSADRANATTSVEVVTVPSSTPEVSTESTQPEVSTDALSRPSRSGSGSGGTVNTAAGPASATSTPDDEASATSTPGGHGGVTTTSSPAVSSTDAHDTSTTDGGTGDTIADQSGRRGSGSGSGGGSDDDTP